MLFTDTHAHLHFVQLHSDIDGILERAEENDIKRFITIGIDYDDSRKAIELASKYDNIYASVGVHPENAAHYKLERDYDRLLKLSKHEKVLAVGEVGLDYHYEEGPSKKDQYILFSDMINLSIEAEKPLIIHSRDAGSDLVQILRDELSHRKNLFKGGIFHCYDGNLEALELLEEFNFYVSFAGNVTYKSAEVIRKALEKVPLSRIFSETDCPYLSPVPMRGKQNEPAFELHTLKFIAEAKKVSLEELSSILENNFKKLFAI